jgi:hypothetical protein
MIDNLNASKFHPVAVPPREHLRRGNSFLSHNVNKGSKGRVFHLQQLHRGSEGGGEGASQANIIAIQKNNRGFTSSKRITAAHAPSMYHWLFHRCGIAFEETKRLVQHRRLLVDGVAVEKEMDLEYQLEWDAFRNMNVVVKVPSSTAAHQQPSSSPSDMVEVPALQRALHRSYALMLLDPSVAHTNDISDPRSFVHRLDRLPCLPPTDARGKAASRSSLGFIDDISRVAVNVLRPAGVLSRRIDGLGLVTNDVSTVRFWNNEFLGNIGQFDIRFREGAPIEAYTAALADISEALRGVAETVFVSKDVVLPCQVTLEELGPSSSSPQQRSLVALAPRLFDHRKNRHGGSGANVSTPLSGAPLSQSHRLLVETPLLPFRLVQRLQRNGAFISLLKAGPFQLPASLLASKQRLLSVEELVAFFAFEKKMKTNLLVYTLREFDRGDREAPISSGGDAEFDETH